MSQPTWRAIDRDYAQVRRRVGMQGRLGWFLSGILPTYQVERNWPGDQLDLWGANGRTSTPSPAGHPSISLHNGSDLLPEGERLELLVWRVVAKFMQPSGFFPQLVQMGFQDLHIFTPLQTYNPSAVPDAIPLQFPFLQPVDLGESVRLARVGHLDVGSNPALMVLVINGVPTTGIGPIVTANLGAGISTAFGVANHLDFGPGAGDVPPIRLKPGQKLTIQGLIPSPGGGDEALDASFWWSERRYDRGL